jgi:uncharacterized protein with GYD domain
LWLRGGERYKYQGEKEVNTVKFILLAKFRRRLTQVDTNKTDEIIKANPQVKVISMDWVLGRYDGVVIAEAPNEDAWLKFVEPLGDYVTTETLVAIPRDKVLKIIEHR